MYYLIEIPWEYPFLVLLGFIVSIINTMAGGASIITLPILIFLGLPSNVANGTNRIGLMMTAFSDLETTVKAFDNGAWDYLAKPFDIHTAISKIDKVISEKKSVTVSNKQIEEVLPKKEKTVDRSEAMQDLFNAIGKLMFVLSPGQDLKESDLHKQLFIQTEKEEQNWEEILESWAEKQLSKGEDHLLNVATPIFERTMINVALKSTRGNKSEAAKLLGWGRNTLARKIQELDI